MTVLEKIADQQIQVQLHGGPLDGMIYWVHPSKSQITPALLQHPFRAGVSPGKVAVYVVSGRDAHYSHDQEASAV